MPEPAYEDIHLLARNSDWAAADIHRALRRYVYAGPREWQKLWRNLLLAAGATFLVSGIFFFFAYNWEALRGGTKIGIAVGAFLLTVLLSLTAPLPRTAQLVLQTATVCLIGAVLAVLGQVYQTGANAYDLFLAWTLLSIPWIAATSFAPLWLVAVALVNVTFITYTQQAGVGAPFLITGMLLFVLNVVCWLVIHYLRRARPGFRWLLQLIACWAVLLATVNVSAGAFDDHPRQLLLTVLLAVVTYAGWCRLAIRERSIYYLALVGAGSLVTVAFLALRWLGSDNSFLPAGLIILVGVTALVHLLNRQNKRWRAN